MVILCVSLAVGQPNFPLEPPSDAAVIAALPKSPLPLIEIVRRDAISLTQATPGAIQIGPRLFYPLMGYGQLVEVTWKCEVSFRERIRLRFPFTVEMTVTRQQIVEIPSSTIMPAP